MERVQGVDPDPGQIVLRDPVHLKAIFSQITQLQQVVAANGVCRQWRDVVQKIYIERHLGVVGVGTARDLFDVNILLQLVTLNFDPDEDKERNFLFDKNYARRDTRLCLRIKERQPSFFISKLVTSKWVANSTVVQLELVDCLTRDEWGEVGLIILKAFRGTLETASVDLMPNTTGQPFRPQDIPLCFSELVDQWAEMEGDQDFRCPNLRIFHIEYSIEVQAVQDPPEQAELERLVRGGPREVFALCPNLLNFHVTGTYVDGPGGRRIRIVNGMLFRGMVRYTEPRNFWTANFIHSFNDHPDEPAPPQRAVQLLNYIVRDLFAAERRLPLRVLSTQRIPDIPAILTENPALCENLEKVKFKRLCNQTRQHIEYLTSTRDLRNVTSLCWSLDLRGQIDLEAQGFQLPPVDRDQEPLFPNLLVFWLHRERKPDPTAVRAPAGGFMVENWLCNNYHALAPNIRRFIINVYSLEHDWPEWRGYESDLQNGLRMASTLQGLTELVLVVRHASPWTHTAHNLVAQEAIPCLKGIQCLTITAVTSTFLISLGEFFIRACQPGVPSDDPAVNTTIRRIQLYRYPDIMDAEQGRRPRFRLNQLTVAIPDGLEVGGDHRWSRVEEQLFGVPPPPPPAPPAQDP